MAKAANKIKRKPVYFNLDDPKQFELQEHADSLSNFSDWVKKKLSEDKLFKTQEPPEDPKLDPNEIAALVESIVETKLAGRVIATDQAEKTNDTSVDLDQFF